MICPPCQRVALENASKLLKPGGVGTLAVADFFLRGTRDSTQKGLVRCARGLERLFQKLWFEQVCLTHPLSGGMVSLGGEGRHFHE